MSRKPYTVRDMYTDLPGLDGVDRDRWSYPLIVEMDGARPGDPDGLVQRGRVVVLDYDDDRAVAVLKTES
jgi:hypothetical protein